MNVIQELKELIKNISDGITIELVNEGQGSLLQFFQGTIKKCPIKIKIVIEDDRSRNEP
jgi:hypothetical protein